jgi:hypothetical protein
LIFLEADKIGRRFVSSLFNQLVEKSPPLFVCPVRKAIVSKRASYQPTFAGNASRVIAAKMHRTPGLFDLKKQHETFRGQAPVLNVALPSLIEADTQRRSEMLGFCSEWLK